MDALWKYVDTMQSDLVRKSVTTGAMNQAAQKPPPIPSQRAICPRPERGSILYLIYSIRDAIDPKCLTHYTANGTVQVRDDTALIGTLNIDGG